MGGVVVEGFWGWWKGRSEVMLEEVKVWWFVCGGGVMRW